MSVSVTSSAPGINTSALQKATTQLQQQSTSFTIEEPDEFDTPEETPATVVDISDRAKATLARAESDQKVADTLQSYIDARKTILEGAQRSHQGTDKNDTFNVQENYAQISGGAGDDTISAFAHAKINGGDGDDTINAYAHAKIVGGSGNDKITTGAYSTIAGGDGNDIIKTQNSSRVYGGAGNDNISATNHSRVSGGEGNDTITTYSHSKVSGGAGNDTISTYSHSTVNGGTGNDTIEVGSYSNVSGGKGNDNIALNGSGSTVAFNKGDGRDTISTSGFTTLNIGAGYSQEDVTISKQGGKTVISFAGSDDQITLDLGSRATVRLSFADQSSLNIQR